MTKRSRLWGNLVGPPARWSPARVASGGGKLHRGWVKIRLCHGKGRSYFLPEFIVGFGGTKFFLPSFFGPPSISFNVPTETGGATKYHEATFSADIAAPKGSVAHRIIVTFTSNDLAFAYGDGALLYNCRYSGNISFPLAPLVSGECFKLQNGDFALGLHHHTTLENLGKILKSKELWSGPYNLAGTAKLENVAYTYFTTLSEIKDETDLHRIAMSSGGVIPFQTTTSSPSTERLDLPVYRSTTTARTSTLSFKVPSAMIAPAHLLFHSDTNPDPAYYECVAPEIVRVALRPGGKLKFEENRIVEEHGDLKRFDYIVEGNASTVAGLEAPMREETTSEIAHLENLGLTRDLFSFWWENRNTDQFSNRAFEIRHLSAST